MECVAIDGVAGAGKTTVAKLLAEKLGWYYLNSGSLYRTFAFKCLQMNVDINDTESVKKCADKIEIDVVFDKKTGAQTIFVNKEQVDFNKLAESNVEFATTIVAQVEKVRNKLTEIQRHIASNFKVVMEGRDVGTVVIPNSKYKFFLIASMSERVKRVKKRQKSAGIKNISTEQIEKDLQARDERDMKRKISPLKKADDAILVDSSNMPAEKVAEKMYKIIKDYNAELDNIK